MTTDVTEYIPDHFEVETIDNRDSRTTRLWIVLPDGKRAYIEVDPIDLLDNMIQNLPEEAAHLLEHEPFVIVQVIESLTK